MSVALGTGTVRTGGGAPVGMVAEGDQRGGVAIRHQPDVATLATVTAIGTTHRRVCLTSERHRAGATVSATHVQTTFVHELRHDHEDTARSAVTRLLYSRCMGTPTIDTPTTDTSGSSRATLWASTMHGHRASESPGLRHIRHAHDSGANTLGGRLSDREAREELEDALLAPGATRGIGAGDRARPETPDPVRTCFERDRDRILHSSAFRRLAGKTQVFVHPEDHQRTRLTHALEVAQVATAISAAVGANVALTEAIALGHDCGHGPGGHPSEDAFSQYVEGGYDHAVWGADVALTPLNLCAETLDGIRNHSWSRPLPSTPEGEIVSWADRIAYVCHDMEDACDVGIVTDEMLPPVVLQRCGNGRSERLRSFIGGVVEAVSLTGEIGMSEPMAEALAEFRAFNYERIYMRPASVEQSRSVIRVLQALVEHYADRPDSLHDSQSPCADRGRSVDIRPGSPEAYRASVTWVGGMTDRYAFNLARNVLGWHDSDLPRGI